MDERERIYFPDLEMHTFDEPTKRAIEQEVKSDFQEALPGIRQLHKGARLGVYLAYRYYYQLLLKIEKMKPEQVLAQRTRISDTQKLLLLVKAYLRYKSGRI
jgi:phytoene/squalene synthetase